MFKMKHWINNYVLRDWSFVIKNIMSKILIYIQKNNACHQIGNLLSIELVKKDLYASIFIFRTKQQYMFNEATHPIICNWKV